MAQHAGLTLLLEGDQLTIRTLLFKPDPRASPYPSDRLEVVDWIGVDIHVESQGPERRQDSVQARAIQQLLSDDKDWMCIIDDDGNGEVADIVALRLDEDGLLIKARSL